jgi:zinc protease
MAHMLEHLLIRETKTRRDIRAEQREHGTASNATTSFDYTSYYETLTANEENLQWAIGLEADRMINARVEKSILDRERPVTRNELEMAESMPVPALFARTHHAAYRSHSYGGTPLGTRSDIENMPIERLATFYQKYYQPDNAVLTIAGAFHPAKSLEWVAAAFGGRSVNLNPRTPSNRFRMGRGSWNCAAWPVCPRCSLHTTRRPHRIRIRPPLTF